MFFLQTSYYCLKSFVIFFPRFRAVLAIQTLSKPQETLEFQTTKQKESFSLDVLLELPEQWMMGVTSFQRTMDDGVTSFEVYNIVYNITEKKNKLKILLKDQ